MHLALAHRGVPVLGVVLLPALEELWFGLLDGGDAASPGRAWCEDRSGQQRPARLSTRQELGELVLVASRNQRACASRGPWAVDHCSAASA